MPRQKTGASQGQNVAAKGAVKSPAMRAIEDGKKACGSLDISHPWEFLAKRPLLIRLKLQLSSGNPKAERSADKRLSSLQRPQAMGENTQREQILSAARLNSIPLSALPLLRFGPMNANHRVRL